MQQNNPLPSEIKEIIVTGSIKLREVPFTVKVPVFEEIKVEKPIYVDKQVEIPVGLDKIIDSIVDTIGESVQNKVDLILSKLEQSIESRLKEIKSPKIVEELIVNHKTIEVERPIYKEVTIERPVFVDKEVINVVLKDKELINPIITDVPIVNAIITDQKITNAIINDIEVERAVIREKVIDVVHPRFLNLKGEPE